MMRDGLQERLPPSSLLSGETTSSEAQNQAVSIPRWAHLCNPACQSSSLLLPHITACPGELLLDMAPTQENSAFARVIKCVALTLLCEHPSTRQHVSPDLAALALENCWVQRMGGLLLFTVLGRKMRPDLFMWPL